MGRKARMKKERRSQQNFSRVITGPGITGVLFYGPDCQKRAYDYQTSEDKSKKSTADENIKRFLSDMDNGFEGVGVSGNNQESKAAMTDLLNTPYPFDVSNWNTVKFPNGKISAFICKKGWHGPNGNIDCMVYYNFCNEFGGNPGFIDHNYDGLMGLLHSNGCEVSEFGTREKSLTNQGPALC